MPRSEQFAAPENNSEHEGEKFNFPEIEAIKENMISLCGKLKESIDAGKYTALVSDEIGGRIPTLIIRKLIKQLHPEQELKTLFVASGKGKSLPESDDGNYEKLIAYLQSHISESDFVLLISQYAHTGVTIQKLASALRSSEHGLRGLDVAIANSLQSEENLKRGVITSHDEERIFREFLHPDSLDRHIPADNIFVAERNVAFQELDEKHNKFTGVAKERGEEYNPSPILLTKVIEKYGRKAFFTTGEINEFFGIEEVDSAQEIRRKTDDPESVRKYEEKAKEPLTDEEKKEMMETIRKAREDVDTLAQAVLKEVWNV